MSGALAGTLAFAAGAGVTTFFAPCAFPLLPGYVGYYLRESDRQGTLSGVAPGLAAAASALVALLVVGVVGLALGRPVVSRITLFEPLVGGALVVAGAAVLAGRVPEVSVALPARPSSLAGFAVFGAAYALAAAGCVVPLLGGVVGQALTLSPAGAALTLATYAGSVAVPLVGATLLTAAGVDAWREFGRYTGRFQQAAGAVMVLAGVGQLYLSADLLGVF